MHSADRIELPALDKWLDDHRLGCGPLSAVTLLAGGTQHLMLAFNRGSDRFVLREVEAPRSGEPLLREAVILSALDGTDVPHPSLRAAEPDPTVLGYCFAVMNFVDGLNLARGATPEAADAPAYWSAVGPAFAAALGRLGEVDPEAIGVSSLGRPDGFLERQVPRWLWQLERYDRYHGYPGADLPYVDEVARWLEARLPPDQRPGLIHGDVNLSNVLFGRERPSVCALVDWELSTVGDPLLDLGQLLVTWPDVAGQSVLGEIISIHPSAELATAEAIVDAYQEACARDLTHLLWYEVLAAFRLGAILEGSRARACAGQGPVDIGAQLHAAAHGLFEMAHELIGR
jgi:aminoglycoside phosphotransferase (APT) family kinase protein